MLAKDGTSRFENSYVEGIMKGNGGKILGRGKHQEGNLPGIQPIASSFYCVIDPSDLTLSLPECLRGFCKVTLTFESMDEIL